MMKTKLSEHGLSAKDAASRDKWIKLFIYIGLVGGTLVAYEPIRHNGFVAYDDNTYIIKNPNVNGGITRDSIIWAFTKTYASNWHPITWLSHMLDCRLFGVKPFWHHLTNLLFHIANALLLFWLLSNMTGSTSSPQAGAIWASAFVAAVFALHPLQVESVAWAAERKTVLSGFFWFLTIGIYIWYTKRPGIGRYILLFGIYALCIMTKPVVVTLPLALLLLDYWPLERFKSGPHTGSKEVRQPASLGRLLIEKVPLLVLTAALCIITLVAQQEKGAVVSLEAIPLHDRIANMFISYTQYIGKLIWPNRLAVLYPYFSINLQTEVVALCVLLFVLVSVLSVYIGRRRGYVATGWFWYVGTLVPMVGLVQAGSQTMADRYMYFSMLGLLIMAAWLIKDVAAKRPRLRVAVAALAAVALLSAIIITRIQVSYWENGTTLFEHTLKVTKDNPIAENNYAVALLSEGRDSDALPHLLNAVRMDPKYFKARYRLGMLFLKQEKFNEAVSCFTELLPHMKDSPELHYNLAVALSKQNKYDEAIKHFNEALPASDNKADIYVNLGSAYLLQGKTEMAIQNWTNAAQIKSNDAEILNNLAWLLAARDEVSAEDAAKAVRFAENACKLTEYKQPAFLDTLSVAYAAAGRFDDAVAIANKAINAARATGQESVVNNIQDRIKLYQAGKRYREKITSN